MNSDTLRNFKYDFLADRSSNERVEHYRYISLLGDKDVSWNTVRLVSKNQGIKFQGGVWR
jgi:hypothetical protein